MDNPAYAIKECIAGNRIMQNKLYEYYASRMMGICLRYSKDHYEAEEILQESFIRVFRYLHQYKHKGSLEGWIKRIVINAALQKIRSNTVLYPVINIENIPQQYLENSLLNIDTDVKEMLMLVQNLPTMCRIIFNLYVFEGMKHREIAIMLKISEGSSKSTLHDARAILQKQLEEEMQILKSNYKDHG